MHGLMMRINKGGAVIAAPFDYRFDNELKSVIKWQFCRNCNMIKYITTIRAI